MKDYDTYKHLQYPVLAKTVKCQKWESPTLCRMTVNGKRSELSLKRKVYFLDWDSAKSRLKAISDENKLLNNYLEQVNSKLFECYQKLQNGNKLATSDSIKAIFLRNEVDRHSLSDIIDYDNVHMESTLRWGTPKNYTPSINISITF